MHWKRDENYFYFFFSPISVLKMTSKWKNKNSNTENFLTQNSKFIISYIYAFENFNNDAIVLFDLQQSKSHNVHMNFFGRFVDCYLPLLIKLISSRTLVYSNKFHVFYLNCVSQKLNQKVQEKKRHLIGRMFCPIQQGIKISTCQMTLTNWGHADITESSVDILDDDHRFL